VCVCECVCLCLCECVCVCVCVCVFGYDDNDDNYDIGDAYLHRCFSLLRQPLVHDLTKRYGPTDEPTDGPTEDRPSYRDVRTHSFSIGQKGSKNRIFASNVDGFRCTH